MEPTPISQYNCRETVEDDQLILYMGRRHALLMELGVIEDYLIKRGRLHRRSVPTQRERNERGIATKP